MPEDNLCNLEEALPALRSGKRIQCEKWSKFWIELDAKNNVIDIVTEGGKRQPWLDHGNWLLYHHEILGKWRILP